MAEDIDPMLTGAAFDLANAGYSPMPDPEERKSDEAIGSDRASLRAAAEQRSAARDPVVKRQYTDSDGEPASSSEAITLARAARDYAGIVAAEKLAADREDLKALAEHVDALREEALSNDPDAADTYGFDVPRMKAEQIDPDENVETERHMTLNQSDDPTSEPSAKLDPELEKALQHPQVLQAIEERVGEAEKARQSYRDGLAAAAQIAQAAFLGQFPELVGVPQEHLPAALEQMSRQDPAKFSQVKAMVATAEQLFAQQAHEHQRQADITRQNFLKLAHAEDTRLETMLKDEPRATQQAVAAEILAAAKASGIEPAELNRLFQTEPLMRNATFQRMMYDAGKYRLMMKARDAAVARPVPPVQRPGMATTRSERERADLRTLSSKLSASGDIKDAVALYQARKSGKR